ncbi:MAG: thiopurine S-methyltransferase [Nitrococcus sp.]|nr:thiopurine S-methyltransferase [Nitrococcus sp.]
MNREFWLERWAHGEIGFHQADINSYLQRYWSALEVPAGASVLVPLCGKSRDMAWLIAQGYTVLGVEISRQAAEQFFSDNGVQASHEPCPPFIRYYASGIDLLVGDIFDLEADTARSVEAVYDRASLVALPSTMRVSYAEHLADLLRPGTRVLLIAFEYDQNQMQGPPFAVLEAEMHDLYADTFEVEVLGAADVLDNYPRFRERGLSWLTERVYRLTRRR